LASRLRALAASAIALRDVLAQGRIEVRANFPYNKQVEKISPAHLVPTGHPS
jgi:hypothetical protein